jgi:membrane protease YdiL (CAAX protease family)
MAEPRSSLVPGAWERIPVPVRAILAGVAVLLVGSVPWSGFVAANLKVAPSIPWAVPLMGLYGWLLYKYLNGSGWPRSTAESRRLNLRLRSLSGEVWLWSLAAGGSGACALLLLAFVSLRLGTVPAAHFDEYAQLAAHPAWSVLTLLLMSAIVAGAVEEAAFRGYMQAPLERRYGIVIALATVAVIYYAAHFAPLTSLPLFLLGAVVFGLLAYLTGSILPGLILHASVDGVSAFWSLLNHDQAKRLAAATVWTAGFDASFWVSCCLAVGFGIASFCAYRVLATKVGRPAQRGRQ